MSGPAVPPPAVKGARQLNCPNCGGLIEVRGMQHTRSAVCAQCLTIIDPSTPELRIIQQFETRVRERALIPLGTRGKLHGTPYEVIGFQVRVIVVDSVEYSWQEYLLFNPYKGFRYLTHYQGHWNDVITIKGLPQITKSGGKKAAKYLGATYRHFQTSLARTAFVLGEFPWQVKVGESVEVNDYVAPPQMLSSEVSAGEVNWSLGTYLTGRQVWDIFKPPGAPPQPQGVFANQPSPHTGKVRDSWTTFMLLLLAWAVLLALFAFSASNREVFRQTFTYFPERAGEQSFVSDFFDLGGRTANVEVELRTDLNNNWAYFNLALINDQTGQGFDFGRQVSYYHGRDSDGNWSEGSARDSVVVPRVPAGRYYLRIEPETDPNDWKTSQTSSIRYEVVVKRDVPSLFWFWVALPFLLIPPLFRTFRSASYEQRRWAESDYAPSGDDDDD
jgi:hypothetical protein